MSVISSQVTLTDGLEIQDRFLGLLRTSKEIPTTSQPAPADFQKVFESCLGAGNEVVVLTISSRLSGTFTSAVAGARQVGTDRITILDSKTTAAGLAMLVETALAAAVAGQGRQEIAGLLQQLIPRTRIMFVPDTLEYLKRGGRIGGAGALLGSLLQIRPVLEIREGQVEVLDKVRTRTKALQRLLAELPAGHKGPVGVIHIAAPDLLQEFLPLVQIRAPGAEIKVYEAGPVIATHTGPGTLGLSFFYQGGDNSQE